MANASAGKAPAHLWVVGAISLLWNGYGAFDYVMSVSRNKNYLANFPPEVVQLLDAFPAWANVAWGTGVWASLLGSILLIARSRYAVLAFVVSLLGALVSFAFQMSIDLPAVMANPSFKFMPVIILVLIVLQTWYSQAMRRRGVLG